jgi:hypothetical protein
MSEEERKEKHKAVRIILYISRIAGIATFVGGLFIAPYAYCDAFVSSGERDGWFFMHFLLIMLFSTMFFYGPLFAISLILSIVTLFIKQDIRSRLRPLILVLAGFSLHVVYLYTFIFF